ncbi:MAG: hypothetical protein WB852_08230 [Thermoplasmata archaeon]
MACAHDADGVRPALYREPSIAERNALAKARAGARRRASVAAE